MTDEAARPTTARSREDIEARVRAAISRELDQLVGRGVSEPIEPTADRLLHAVMGALVRAGVDV